MSKKIAAKKPVRKQGARSLTRKRTTPRHSRPADASAEGGLDKSDVRHLQKLLRAQMPGGVPAGLSTLHRLKAAEADWKSVLTPRVMQALAESWNPRTWQAVAESLAEFSTLRSAFESAVTLHFTRLSKPQQRAVLERTIGDLTPPLVNLGKALVAIVNERSRGDDEELFPRLQRLPDAGAEALTDYCRGLSFPSLKRLSDNAAGWLGKCTNGYGLGLTALALLSDATAAGLAQYGGGPLYLNGLRSLTEQAAKSLGRAKATELWLGGLRSISDTAASHLARYRGRKLVLWGLKTLSDNVATHVATYAGDVLDVRGLHSLSDVAAARFAMFEGQELDLSGLRSLSDQAIEALARGNTHCVRLDGLRTISEHAAKVLERREPNAPFLSLDGLSGRMPSATAEALVRGGYSLTPADGVSPPSIDIVFDGPVDIEMIRATSSRNRRHSHATTPDDCWRIALDGKSHTITEGQLGAAGRSTRKSFAGPKAALKSFAKAIWAKELEGFEVVKKKD